MVAGLRHSQAQGVWHLDVKPDNLLVVGDCVKLSDFGCSALTRRTLQRCGTAEYGAPEVCVMCAASGRMVGSARVAAFVFVLPDKTSWCEPWCEPEVPLARAALGYRELPCTLRSCALRDPQKCSCCKRMDWLGGVCDARPGGGGCCAGAGTGSQSRVSLLKARTVTGNP